VLLSGQLLWLFATFSSDLSAEEAVYGSLSRNPSDVAVLVVVAAARKWRYQAMTLGNETGVQAGF
jgi:hypothetical protein